MDSVLINSNYIIIEQGSTLTGVITMNSSESDFYTGDEELRGWLHSYINEHPHHTTAVLSRSEYIGMSRTAIEAYLKGTYFLPEDLGGQGANPEASSIEDSIRAFRLRVEGTERHGYVNTFVETRTYKQLRQACLLAINENMIVVVYGRPGIGKSRGLLEFSKREMTTAPLIILCSRNVTWYYFVRMIAKSLGLDIRNGTTELEDLIAEKLMRTPRPIFVDQANYLNEKGLGTVCHIWERAKIPIGLFGTKDLFDLFMTSGQTEDVRAQLSSRVGIHYLLPELSLGEVKSVVRRALKEEAKDALIAQIYKVTGGVHRHVDMILPRILDLRERNKEKLIKGEVTMKDIVNTAGSRLMM